MADNSKSASTQVFIHRNILPSVALLQRLHFKRASEAGQNRGKIRLHLQHAWLRPTADEQLRSKASGSDRTRLNTAQCPSCSAQASSPAAFTRWRPT